MTAGDGDGIDEDLTRAVSVAMIATARAGEQLARMNQTAARARDASATGDAEQAQRQLEAHTEAARAYFEIVTRPEYLTAATDKQIQEVTRQAQAWRERLPEARRAEEAATGELETRHPTDRDSQRAPVLVGEADAADRRAVEISGRGRESVEMSSGTDDLRQDSSTPQPGLSAAARAANAQTELANRAPAARYEARRRPAGGDRHAADHVSSERG